MLQFVLKLSAFSFCACAKSLAPLTHRRVNNSLVKIVPCLHDSLTKIFNITDLCFAYHFLHSSPYLIIDGIQIWAVRGPECRIYEVRSFIRQKCISRPLCAGAPSCLKMWNSENSRISGRKSWFLPQGQQSELTCDPEKKNRLTSSDVCVKGGRPYNISLSSSNC